MILGASRVPAKWLGVVQGKLNRKKKNDIKIYIHLRIHILGNFFVVTKK